MLNPRLVTDAVLVLLRDTDDDDAGPSPRRIGDHDGPDVRRVPYGRLDTIPGGTADGSWGDPVEDGSLVLQVLSVGETRDQAQLHQWWMRVLILGRDAGGWAHPIVGPGWKVYHRELDMDGGVEGGGDSPTWNASDRFRLFVTRA